MSISDESVGPNSLVNGASDEASVHLHALANIKAKQLFQYLKSMLL